MSKTYIGEDGLQHCSVCHKNKELIINWLGKDKRVACVCDCDKAKDLELAKKREAERIERLRSECFPNKEMQNWNFKNDDGKNLAQTTMARNYVSNFEQLKSKGKGFIFYGTCGTGKTYLASCIANALTDVGYKCLVTSFPRLVNDIQGMFEGKQEYIDNLNKYSLLVIDDLASERDTDFMLETEFNIIDTRYRSGKPLIVTTNLTLDELTHPANIRKARIYSRLMEMCIPIEVNGADRRMQTIDVETLKLLGL